VLHVSQGLGSHLTRNRSSADALFCIWKEDSFIQKGGGGGLPTLLEQKIGHWKGSAAGLSGNDLLVGVWACMMTNRGGFESASYKLSDEV
jgi:hypothetical protein